MGFAGSPGAEMLTQTETRLEELDLEYTKGNRAGCRALAESGETAARLTAQLN
jgi:hypothetical protein